MYPVLFEIGGYTVSSFGFMIAVGTLVGTYIASRRFAEAGYDPELTWTVAVFIFVGCIVGSKLWFVGERIARSDGPVDIGALLGARGGMTFYGGAVGGMLMLWVGTRVAGLSVWTVVNLVPVAGMVSHALGRIGCFLVGDDYGRPTDLPWGVAFPEGRPPTLETVHPTMLYECAWLLLGAWVLHQRRGRSLSPWAEYCIWAGAGRLAVEQLRLNPAFLGPLSNAQVIALIGVLAGIGLWVYVARLPEPWPYTARQGDSHTQAQPTSAAAPRAMKRRRRRA